MDEEYQVTLAIYSGRPDPCWTVPSRHGSFQKVKELHRKAKATIATYGRHEMPTKLGFKGFLLYTKGTEYPDLIIGEETAALQHLLFDTMPKELIEDDLHKKILQFPVGTDVKSVKAVGTDAKSAKAVVQKQLLGDAPSNDLGKWNNEFYTRWNNNCYNYSRDIITNTFAQPGKGSGHPFQVTTAAAVQQASIYDGVDMLQPQPGPTDPCPTNFSAPAGRTLVALVVAPGVDFHWYRLDSDTYWSHKPGKTPATGRDGVGNWIKDPRKAANDPSGPYYQFVAFMTTKRNLIA